MKLSLKMTFCTDGDFRFLLTKELIDPKSSFYNGAVKEFLIINEPENEFIDITLECEGDECGCQWAARDVMENLIRGGILTVHYWLVQDIYELVIKPKERMLWGDKDVHYYDSMSGNYNGTEISLDIVHEKGDRDG